MRILIGGRSYPRKNDGKDKELMVKDTIVRGKNVNARFKMEQVQMQNACEATKTILYEQKHFKHDDRPVTWKIKYGISFMNYELQGKNPLEK